MKKTLNLIICLVAIGLLSSRARCDVYEPNNSLGYTLKIVVHYQYFIYNTDDFTYMEDSSQGPASSNHDVSYGTVLSIYDSFSVSKGPSIFLDTYCWTFSSQLIPD